MELEVYDFSKNKLSDKNTWPKLNISEKNINEKVIHKSVIMYLANKRAGTAKSKTRGEISGTGKKPWKQKGTGNARAGSLRSPIFRGGSKAFGPVIRNYSYRLPKKALRIAFSTVLADKLRDKKIKILENVNIDKPSTKKVWQFISKFDLDKSKLLCVFNKEEKSITLSFRNIKNILFKFSDLVNTYDILNSDTLILTRKAFEDIEKRIGEKTEGRSQKTKKDEGRGTTAALGRETKTEKKKETKKKEIKEEEGKGQKIEKQKTEVRSQKSENKKTDKGKN
jgi:large subunit ribosomal protein L4